MEDLLVFLKKYSDIDLDFIKKFIEIRNNKNLHFPFSIDLDIVSAWLKTRKGLLKKTLINSYFENIDFIILKSEKKERTNGGQNKEIILMTPDTFKMLTMRSATKEARKVRYYYVVLEKLVEIYKDDIIENQNKKIKILERNLKKIKYPVKGALYIIQLTEYDTDGFRIGKTFNLNKRVKGSNTHNKDDPEVMYTFYTNDRHRLEKCVRNALKYYEYRNNKDFYVTTKQNIIDALSDCNELITKYVNNVNDQDDKDDKDNKDDKKNDNVDKKVTKDEENEKNISREYSEDKDKDKLFYFKIEFDHEDENVSNDDDIEFEFKNYKNQKGGQGSNQMGEFKSLEMLYKSNKSNYNDQKMIHEKQMGKIKSNMILYEMNKNNYTIL